MAGNVIEVSASGARFNGAFDALASTYIAVPDKEGSICVGAFFRLATASAGVTVPVEAFTAVVFSWW